MAEDGALSDLLVLELGDEGTQYCGQLLADMGARVIKIEPPEGCGARHRGPFKDDRPDVDASLYFWANNTSKESVTLDLNTDSGRQTVRQLAQKADILLEDYPPGYLSGFGLGFDQLSVLNPGLIVTSVTPFGQTGPWKDWRGGDLVQWATGGILSGGYADDPETPPILAQGDLSFITAGHWALIGTLVALAARDVVSGEGQHADISIQESCSCVNRGAVTESGFVTSPGAGPPIRLGSFAEDRIQCKDGAWFLPWALNMRPSQWEQLQNLFTEEGVGQELWGIDFATIVARSPRERVTTDPVVRQAIMDLAARKTAREISVIGMEMGMTWAVFNAPDELIEDEQLQYRHFFQQVHHPEHDAAYTYAGEPFSFSSAGWKIRRRPPLLGEDNDKLPGLL